MRLVAELSRSLYATEFGVPLLAAVARLLGYRKSAFIFLDTESFEASYPVFRRIPLTAIERYRSFYREEGIFLRAIERDRNILSKKLLTVDDVMSAESYERSAYYSEVAKPAETRDIVLLPLSGRRRVIGGLAIFKPEAEGSFGESEKALLSALNEPLSGLLEVHVELQGARRERAAVEETLEGSPAGAIVVDCDGNIVRANSAARRLSELAFPCGPDRAVADLVSALVDKGALRPGSPEDRSSFRLEGSGLVIRIHPLSYNDPAHGITYRSIVYVEESRRDAGDCSRLADKYALSGRETEIVARVIRGEGNLEISEGLFMSPNTLRTHFQNIFRKLGINSRMSIIQLARMLA
jgi:DNA-binding CsgD family transcriptional regulator